MCELVAVSILEQAATQALDCDVEDLKKESYDHYGLVIFSGNGQEIAIGTDEQVDQAASEYIRESLWSFNPSFILNHSRVAYSDKLQKALVHLQRELCEDANPLIEALIKDLEHFISNAIRVDGRGMFLSPYDNEEQEIDINEVTYYYYKLN